MVSNLVAVIPRRARVVLALVGLLLAGLTPALAQGVQEPLYRTFFGVNPRLALWVIAELHLLFAAFVLGVPVFAVMVEIVGTPRPRNGTTGWPTSSPSC